MGSVVVDASMYPENTHEYDPSPPILLTIVGMAVATTVPSMEAMKMPSRMPMVTNHCERVTCSVDALGEPDPVFLPQIALEDLAGPAFRQRFEELDRLGDLEVRQTLTAECDQLLLGRVRPGLQDDHGLGHLTPLFIGHGDDGDLEDRGVGKDGGLDLDRRDVLTAADDDVFETIDDENVPFFVDHSHVAGMEP